MTLEHVTFLVSVRHQFPRVQILILFQSTGRAKPILKYLVPLPSNYNIPLLKSDIHHIPLVYVI
jgi:hypothetical protein